MKKELFLAGTLIFIFTFLSLPLAGTSLGTVQAQTKPAGPVNANTWAPLPIFNALFPALPRWKSTEMTIPVENRIYVSCANSPGGGIFSFASAIGTNPGNANRYLVMLNTAVALGKTVSIFYDISTVNNPIGCQSDCRKLTGLVLGP